MKYYVIDHPKSLSEDLVAEVEGHPLTGHPDKIQANGIRANSCHRRIFGRGQWFGSRKDGLIALAKRYREGKERSEVQMKREAANIQWFAERLERVEKAIESLDRTVDL